MQRGGVYINNLLAATIEKNDTGSYTVTYYDDYFNNTELPAISLTLPKTQKIYKADKLFPFFYGLLAEGVNKDLQCRTLKIDEQDDFTRLLKTAGNDTIGAVTIREDTNEV